MALQSDVRGQETSNGVCATAGPPQFTAASEHQEEQRQRPGDEDRLDGYDPLRRRLHKRRASVDDDR